MNNKINLIQKNKKILSQQIITNKIQPQKMFNKLSKAIISSKLIRAIKIHSKNVVGINFNKINFKNKIILIKAINKTKFFYKVNKINCNKTY